MQVDADGVIVAIHLHQVDRAQERRGRGHGAQLGARKRVYVPPPGG